MADAVQPSLVGATGCRDRGVKSKNLGVLNPDFHDSGTACCLVEVSFLTHPEEEARLLSADYQDRVATALAGGIKTYFDLPIAKAPVAVAASFEEDAALANAASPAGEEAALWAQKKGVAEAALAFHRGFLGIVSGADGNAPLGADGQTQLKLIQRAVSWVESKHGTAGSPGNQPTRDPMQCGNPADSWWRELTGQTTKQSRFVRGPGLTNLNASELPAAAEAAGLTAVAALSRLSDRNTGHDDQNFVADTSYYWGTPLLLHRINTGAGFPGYRRGDLSSAALIDGAVAYNGGGDPDYKAKIVAALVLIGGLPSDPIIAAPSTPTESRVADLPALVGDSLRRAIGAAADAGRTARSVSITVELTD